MNDGNVCEDSEHPDTQARAVLFDQAASTWTPITTGNWGPKAGEAQGGTGCQGATSHRQESCKGCCTSTQAIPQPETGLRMLSRCEVCLIIEGCIFPQAL